MLRRNVIAIFDIGKTNKKLFLLDEQYHVVAERAARFDETVDEDGDPCENVAVLSEWVRQSFAEIMSDDSVNVRAVNFSAYGASFVHVSESGDTLFPLYNYLKSYPSGLQQRFFSEYGGEEELCKATASPVLGSLNSGLQLYRLRYERKLHELPGYSLHLPQYISFLITGRAWSELTSLGCHTMMWDFGRGNYHRWVKDEGLLVRLPPLRPSDDVIPVNYGGREILAGVGLHDSSSALIPYLSIFAEPFILISTGTWCITLNPFSEAPLTAEELRDGCLCYLGYHGRTVKASRLFAGHDHEIAVRTLSMKFGVPVNFYESVSLESSMVESIRGLPAAECADYAAGANYEEAYHRLMIDIVRRQEVSSRLVLGAGAIKKLFVDGGFARNALYMQLLARAFPEMEVYSSSVPQGSAIGAALAIHRHWNAGPVPSTLISCTRVEPNGM